MASSTQTSSSTQAIKTNQLPDFRCDTHSAALLKHLQTRQDLCDVVLIAGESGKRISAHRLILIASSDYFSDLLCEPKGECQEYEVILKDVDGDALEKLVNFCYTGSLELRVDTMKTIITTANYLQLKEITEGCSEFFQRHLKPSNCLAVSVLAEQLNLEELLRNAKKFICENFEEFSNHDDFFLLNAKQLSELIASDDLEVPSEEFVFWIVMKWVEYEPENRTQHFTELLAQVRLPLLTPTFLTENVEPFCNTQESQKLFLNALKSHLLLTTTITQPRQSSSKSIMKQLWAICVNAITQPNENLAIAGYNLHTKVWTIWDTPIECRCDFAVALMGEDLIMVGGIVNGSPVNKVTKLNLRTMTSSEMAPLTTSRSEHAVAVLKGSIYAIGGFNGRRSLNSVERWDPVSGTWGFVAQLENARRSPGVAVINGRLYVSGGLGDTINIELTSMECYDMVGNTWISRAPMKMPRKSHSLASHKGYLFKIGGYYDKSHCCDLRVYYQNTIECYDPSTDEWKTISCSPEIRGYCSCASLGPDLFICSNDNFYTTSSESSCDNLKLQKLLQPEDAYTDLYCTDLFATSFEFTPPEKWIRNKVD